MKIAVNAQLLSEQASYRGAGVSNYSAELLRALGALALEEGAGSIRLTAYVHARGFTAPGVDLAHSPHLLERPMARIAWEQTCLPLHLRRMRAQLVHGLVNVLPLASSCPGVVTVHDLSFVRTPETLPPLKRAYQTALCRASVARAAHIIAVSNQTARDLQTYFGTPASRISVVYNGVSPRFVPRPDAANRTFRLEHGLPERYLLYLGTLEPRKNLELLLRAFAVWRKGCSPEARAVKLVLAGGKGWYFEEIFRTAGDLGLAEQVIFPGFVPNDELPAWYAAADAFIYPSLFEGFGLPVLEAMACGTPVLCSSAPGVSEVAGDAALTFPAADEGALVDALHLMMGQPELRCALSARGLARAAGFTWRRCADATRAVYARVAG